MYNSGKTYAAISRLPDNPKKHIYWIVYNQDMVQYITDMIASIKGPEYMPNISVVAKGDSSKERSTGMTYFDPGLFDLIGNGEL